MWVCMCLSYGRKARELQKHELLSLGQNLGHHKHHHHDLKSTRSTYSESPESHPKPTLN